MNDNTLAEAASSVLTYCVPNSENGRNGARGPYLKRGWQPFFLSELERTHCVKAALDKAKVSRRTYQRYKAAHPEFAAACHEAGEIAVDRVEAVVYWRCLNGDTVKRFDREGREYFETVYPDALIIRYLQAHLPEKWHRHPAQTPIVSTAGTVPRVIIMPSPEDTSSL